MKDPVVILFFFARTNTCGSQSALKNITRTERSKPIAVQLLGACVHLFSATIPKRNALTQLPVFNAKIFKHVSSHVKYPVGWKLIDETFHSSKNISFRLYKRSNNTQLKLEMLTVFKRLIVKSSQWEYSLSFIYLMYYLSSVLPLTKGGSRVI